MVKSVSIHPCAKNIRDIREITSLWSVGLRQISCSKKIICNPWENTNNYPCAKTFVLFEKFVFKEKSVFIHPRANEQSYFRIFLPFFITTPACRLPLMAQPERSYSLPSIAFVVRTDVMPDFMSSGISLFSNISVPFS